MFSFTQVYFKFVFLGITLFCSSGLAATLSADEVFEKLKPLAKQAKYPTVFRYPAQIIVVLPTEKDRGNERQEWIYSDVKAVINGKNEVPQIFIETENCNVSRQNLDIEKMQLRLQEQIRTISSAVFNHAFDLNEGYFKELGPHWEKYVRVPIREKHPGIKSMRITRSIAKCDAREGYSFRYDFFL